MDNKRMALRRLCDTIQRLNRIQDLYYSNNTRRPRMVPVEPPKILPTASRYPNPSRSERITTQVSLVRSEQLQEKLCTHQSRLSSLIDHGVWSANQDQPVIGWCRKVLFQHGLCHPSLGAGPSFGDSAEGVVESKSAIGELDELIQFFSTDCKR